MSFLKKLAFPGLLALAFVLGGFIAVGEAARDDVWALLGRGASRNTDILRVPQAGTSLLPGTDNAFALGSTSKRYSGVFTYGGNFAGNVTLGDAVTDVVTLTGLMTITSNADPDTNITPTAEGQLAWSSTANRLCVSTGSAAGSWVLQSSTEAATACPAS